MFFVLRVCWLSVFFFEKNFNFFKHYKSYLLGALPLEPRLGPATDPAGGLRPLHSPLGHQRVIALRSPLVVAVTSKFSYFLM